MKEFSESSLLGAVADVFSVDLDTVQTTLASGGRFEAGSAALREMREFVDRSKGGWTLVDPSPEIKSRPTATDIEACELLGKNMAEAIRDR